MGGIDEDAEEIAPDDGVHSFDDIPGFADVGEGGEFDGAEEFEIPGLDGGVGEAGLLVGTDVCFDDLRDSGVVVVAGFGGVGIHPILEGGRGDGFDAKFFGGLECFDGEADEFVLVGWVGRIDSADHEDDVGLDAEFADAVEEFDDVFFDGAGEDGDLEDSQLDG